MEAVPIKWNLSREPGRRPRILFRADQAFNAFSAFASDAVVRIDPDSQIWQERRRAEEGLFILYHLQTLMTEDGKKRFTEYAPDFFDFIIIDECHRGGANDESTWRAILEHFSPAVQLGLTATPKRTINVDTYDYFGEPVYTYALKDGINDGFLTPFKVRQIASTMDDYVFDGIDELVSGDLEQGSKVTEQDFNRRVEIEAREQPCA